MIYYVGGKLTQKPIGLDPSSPAFRYGAGFFETVYYNGNNLCHLDRHLDRLLGSLRAHNIPHKAVDFEEIINVVLAKNNLDSATARVNIIYPIEQPDARPVILAAPYETQPYKAYRLCICEDHHVSTLNAHKTTSYMFFHLALQQARARGFDDAALFDFDNKLLEATTSALLFKKNGEYFQPHTPYKLPSTAMALAGSVLDILSKPIGFDDLDQYRHAYILNSLIGMRPVVAIGETAFVPDEDPCEAVTKLVLGR